MSFDLKRLYLVSDYLMLLFIALAVSSFYSIGGVPSLFLVLATVAFLAVFISMAKGPDIVFIYTVISLFLVTVAFIVGGIAGFIAIALITQIMSTRGLIRLRYNARSLTAMVAIVVGCVSAYLFIPGFYKPLLLGAAGLVAFSFLIYCGRISSYILRLIFTSPREAMHVLAARVRYAWIVSTAALESPSEGAQRQEGRVETSETSTVQTPSQSLGRPSEIVSNEKITNLITHYLRLLVELENSYKDGKISANVYERLRDEYLSKLKNLGYAV
jgi:hypothetical protein